MNLCVQPSNGFRVPPVETEDSKDKEEDCNEDINAIIDLALRDQIMEIEEKIFFGTLGTLKIHDRQAWQKAIQAGGYDKQCDALTWGGKSMMNTPFESRIMSADQSRDQTMCHQCRLRFQSNILLKVPNQLESDNVRRNFIILVWGK